VQNTDALGQELRQLPESICFAVISDELPPTTRRKHHGNHGIASTFSKMRAMRHGFGFSGMVGKRKRPKDNLHLALPCLRT
jgi:hypothetical protein